MTFLDIVYKTDPNLFQLDTVHFRFAKGPLFEDDLGSFSIGRIKHCFSLWFFLEKIFGTADFSILAKLVVDTGIALVLL